MMPSTSLRQCLVALALTGALGGTTAAFAQSAVDVGNQVPDTNAVKEGLFPEDACKELEANGFKCMGFKPAVKYSLPASSFKLGSAELPELLKKQLDVFAEVLKGKKGTCRRRIRRCRCAAPRRSSPTSSTRARIPTCWSSSASARRT